MLQKEGCEPGDYVCRVRAGEQHRSVSCEVELEAGKYEVLPKVTATRIEDWPLVEDVVEMSARRKPQKLRQIGMQYDLSHAKGGVTDEDSLLEQKRADAKAKLAEEKKKIQDEERKAMQDAAKHMEEAAKSLSKAASAGDKKDEEKEKSEKKEDKKGDDSQKKGADDPKITQQPTPEPDSKGLGSSAEGAGSGSHLGPTATEGADDIATEGSVQHEAPEGDGSYAGSEQGQDQEQEGSDDGRNGDGDDDDDDGTPWNAVCVMGLRVYAQDEEVTVTLVKPDTSVEASSLTVGDTPAGATM